MKQIISVMRQLPAPGSILRCVGERVHYDDIVAKVDYIPGSLIKLDAARQLGVFPQQIPQTLTKELEEKVVAGEIIAQHEEFLTLRVLTSPCDGFIAMWSRYLGTVYIREPVATSSVKSHRISCEDIQMNKVQFAERNLVIAGQNVNKGQHLLRGGKAIAPFLSRVERVSLAEGEIILRPFFQPTEIPAFISGTVVRIENDTCFISAVGHRFVGEIGYGGEATGKLRMLACKTEEIQLSEIPDDLGGCIVVVEGSIGVEVFSYLAQQGVAGVVLGTCDPLVLRLFFGRDPLQLIGTQMDTDFPVVLLQGFNGAMSEDTYNSIASFQGYQVALSADTQLRAGVMRPQLLIPLPKEELNQTECLLHHNDPYTLK